MLKLKHPGAVYVGGEWHAVDNRQPIINPANEAVIFEAPVSGVDIADAAIGAARHAFDRGPWPNLSQAERNAILTRFLDAIDARRAEIVALIIAECGATWQGTEYFGYSTAMKHGRAFLELAQRPVTTPLPVETVPSPMGTTTLAAGAMVRDPAGVVTAITPFNAPFLLNIGKIIPAMAVGCTVVLKPSPFTPIEALILGEMADEAGLPPGVLNIITGDVDVGHKITTDTRIDLISFTGSDQVGAAIVQQTASQLKRVLLELGGKSAMIVRSDADLDAAAFSGMFNTTFQAGQGCGLHTRHIVHNSVRPAYVEKVRQLMSQVKIGDPAAPDTAMGPLIYAPARKRTEDYVEIARSQGAKLIAGGRRPDGLDKGFYFEPTLFDEVDNSHRLAREEVFGPIAAVIGFDDDEEAIAMANDSDFGLSGGIFSADAGRAYEMALKIRTGNVMINGGTGHVSSHHPFGGIKRSGFGREYGVEGLNEYTTIKTIAFKGC